MWDKNRISLHRTWSNMIQRCENPGIDHYLNYGGRGIKVCAQWRTTSPRGAGFRNFIYDMGPRPPNMTLERNDVNGNYEPSNCRWATKKEQARNTRKRRIVTFQGKSYHVAELSEKLGIDMRTLAYRIGQEWPDERVCDPSPQYNNHASQAKAVAVHAEKQKARTKCKRGHKFTKENTYLHQGRRLCRECRRMWDRAIYHGTKP